MDDEHKCPKCMYVNTDPLDQPCCSCGLNYRKYRENDCTTCDGEGHIWDSDKLLLVKCPDCEKDEETRKQS